MISRFIPLLIAAPLLAGELTVEPKPFRIEHRFDATVMPADPVLISLKPETWATFTVATLLDHGTEVKKDDLLIRFEREDYEHRLEDLQRSVEKNQLALANAELNVAKLKVENALTLEAATRAKTRAEDNLKYFVEIGRPAEEADLDQTLKTYQFRLDAEKEEMAQLKQMYEEDDLTEATEEIILERQKISIESAEFALAETKRRNQRARDATLPRQHEDLKQAVASATLKWEKAKAQLPRALKTAELDLAATRTALEREKTELERLKQDGALLEIKSPVDGTFFHGSLEDGRWVLGDLAKGLVEGGKLPQGRVVASVVPSKATLQLAARLDPAIGHHLNDGSLVSVSLPGRENIALVGTVSNAPSAPATDGKDPVTISIEWPEDFMVQPTTTAKCIAVVYEKEDAIAIPAKALQADAQGQWSVELKMAEGETKRRQVEHGLATKELIEITSGLEAGQVIVVPE